MKAGLTQNITQTRGQFAQNITLTHTHTRRGTHTKAGLTQSVTQMRGQSCSKYHTHDGALTRGLILLRILRRRGESLVHLSCTRAADGAKNFVGIRRPR